MKVPAAIALNVTSTTSSVSYKKMPIIIPTGVANEKTNSRTIPLLISAGVLKFLHIEIPSDIAAAGLWRAKPSIMFIVALASGLKPNAIPSNIACTVNAISKTRD